MPRNEDYDWIFDYTLQFLESERFDAAIMNFVDEKCLVFEDEDENKLIYTEIHREFCDHVDSLITTNLADVGITSELFVESCERARSGRDINVTVFERLMAMDDFNTFKKLMTKRNTELQLESIRSFKLNVGSQKKTVNLVAESKLDFADISARKTEEMAKSGAKDEFFDATSGNIEQQITMEEEEFQELLFQSLLEMELLHRQEELEHAELERALLLSLAAEEERLIAAMEGLRNLTLDQPQADSKPQKAHQDGKNLDKDLEVKKTQSFTVQENAESKTPQKDKETNFESRKSVPLEPLSALPSLKPLHTRAPLPSIKQVDPKEDNISAELKDLSDRRKAAEEVLRLGQNQLQGQRRAEETLRKELQGVDPAEAQRRAEHMARQREALLAKKRSEREARIENEGGGSTVSNSETKSEKESANPAGASLSASPATTQAPGSDEIAEMRRATMRMALARRLKLDLSDGTQQSNEKMKESAEQFDKQLRQVEQLREENRRRERELNRALERQKETLARNMEASAAALQRAERDGR